MTSEEREKYKAKLLEYADAGDRLHLGREYLAKIGAPLPEKMPAWEAVQEIMKRVPDDWQ